MSKESPVFYDKDFQLYFGPKGVWQVFRYDDTQIVLNDYEHFSSEYLPKEGNPLAVAMPYIDPPDHRQLRLLVSKAFTPKAIEDMKPWIEEITQELINKVIDTGEMDITNDLAIPVPIQVIAKMLGVPYEDRDKFKEWSTTITKQPSEVEGGEIGYYKAQKEMVQYFMEMFESRKGQHSNDDLISKLLQVEVDGEKLSINDVLGFCIILLVAGNETTTNLISSGMLSLIENPQLQEHLYQHPEDIPNMIEEVLRYRAPVQYLTRVAAKDVELRGQKIKKGDLINIWLGAANRDESIFASPDQFDIKRTNLKHTSFGHGIHYCMGAPLARLEANIVFKTLFTQLHQFQLKYDQEPEMNDTLLMYSIKRLPVLFKKR